MSTVLTCQDLSFVGGQLYNCLYRAPTSADCVDVTTETQASFWAAGPTEDTCCQPEPSGIDTLSCLSCETSPDITWTGHMSPHLRRNKQLQDTLIKRDEELARLQEENNRLKEFLNSSYVQNLQEKSQRLRCAQKERKRNLQVDEGLRNLSTSHLLLGSQVKRTCRNLSLEFCSSEDVASTPPVDHWILQTLGLKDADTIDTSTENNLILSLDSVSPCSPNSEHSKNYCQTKSQETSNYSCAGTCPDIELSTNYSSTFNSINNYTVSTDSCSNEAASGLVVQISPNFPATPVHQVTPFPSHLSKIIENPLSPQTKQHFTPFMASSSILFQDSGLRPNHTHSHCQSLITPPKSPGLQQSRSIPAPRSQPDVAFTMSLSSSSSVRTHSFHQGQAFVRKNSEGGWSFTWVPIQDA